MRILYITDQIYLHGGAEKILIQKLNYWADVLGADVLLLTTSQEGRPPFFALSPKVTHKNLSVKGRTLSSYLNPSATLEFPTDFKKVKSAITSFNPDAVFLISLGFIRYILPWAARGYATFNEYHTSYYGFRLGYQNAPLAVKIKKLLAAPLRRWVEDKYTGIVFLNQAEYDHYKRKNGLIIPNFFDPSAQHPLVERKKQVISLGRLSYQKGYDLLLKAWSILEAEFPDWNLAVYGHGENREALEKQMSELGLRNARINPATDEVPQKLAESSIYVMSSRFETFPMVLLEALSAGVPVVSFDCISGPRSILTQGDSLLAPPDDVEALADQLKRLMGNDLLRQELGKNARQNVARFSPATVMAMWVALGNKFKKNQTR